MAIDLIEDPGWEVGNLALEWQGDQIESAESERSWTQKANVLPVALAFALIKWEAQRAPGRPVRITASSGSARGDLLKRVHQVIRDANPRRSRNLWVREVFGPHPMWLTDRNGSENDNALAALLSVGGGKAKHMLLNGNYLQPEDIEFTIGRTAWTNDQFRQFLQDHGLIDETVVGDAGEADDTGEPGVSGKDLLQQAHKLRLAGHYREALEAFNRASSVFGEDGDLKGESECYEFMGRMHLTLGETGMVKECAERALSKARAARSPGHEAAAIGVLGELAFSRIDNEAAKAYFDQARLIYENAGESERLADTLQSLGMMGIRTGAYDDARRDLQKSEELYREKSNLHGVANAVQQLTGVEIMTGNYDAARRLVNRVRVLYQEIGNRRGEGTSLINLGELELAVCNPAAAKAAYVEARRIFDTIGFRLGWGNAQWGVAHALIEEGEYEHALELLLESRQAMSELGHLLGEGVCALSEAKALLKLGRTVEAHDRAEVARALAQRSSARSVMASADRLLGEVAILEERFEDAEAAFDAADGIFNPAKDGEGSAGLLMSRARLAEARGDLSGARSFYQQAAALYRFLNLERQREKALQAAEGIRTD